MIFIVSVVLFITDVMFHVTNVLDQKRKQQKFVSSLIVITSLFPFLSFFFVSSGSDLSGFLFFCVLSVFLSSHLLFPLLL